MAGGPNRRNVILGIAAGYYGSILAHACARATFLSETLQILDAPEPASQFETFYVLSKLVTGRSKLARDIAKQLFPFFRDEPYGPKHIAETYTRVMAGLKDPQQSKTVPELLAAGYLSSSEKWFAEHILTTWYLGIYYHERLSQRVTYSGSLMWEALTGLVPIPGMSDLGHGYWANPPGDGAGEASP